MFALLVAILSFVILSSALFASALTAKSQAKDVSYENLALRFSSFALDSMAVVSGKADAGGFASQNEIDAHKFSSFPIDSAIARAGAAYGSIRIVGQDGAEPLPPRSSGAGNAAGIYCAQRLALMDGKIVRLEACIS